MRIGSMVLFSFLVILYSTSCNQVEPDKSFNESYAIPSQYLTSTEEDTVQVQEYIGGSPAVFSFINPNCEHCHYQTQALLTDHDDKPVNLRLAFLSDVHQDSLKAFANQFEYDTTTTVFLWDEGGKIAQEMGVSSYPTMFLYDTSGVHIETLVGEAKPSYVYKFFNATH